MTEPRHQSVQHVVDLLEPNPNLPEGSMAALARRAAEFRDEVLDEVEDGPELTAGLRKLLEAKDCFVRQALIDSRKASK